MWEYLADNERFMVAGALRAWLEGRATLTDEAERRVRVTVLREMRSLPWEAIARFYGTEETSI